ncbi:MAG: ankyrin repeat domain-containing protein [Gammaproteobacteria bacterium]|nr:ankyrin repeat domain-containing protein [Gammaproteobacteria bacterium]
MLKKELTTAIEKGDLAKFQTLLKSNPDLLLEPIIDDFTLLHLAAVHDKSHIFSFILNEIATLTHQTHSTVISNAVSNLSSKFYYWKLQGRNASKEAVAKFFRSYIKHNHSKKSFPQENTKNPEEQLITALENRNETMVKEYLKADSKWLLVVLKTCIRHRNLEEFDYYFSNWKDTLPQFSSLFEKANLVHECALFGANDILFYLTENIKNLDLHTSAPTQITPTDNFKWTPLHIALYTENRQLAEFLLDHGAPLLQGETAHAPDKITRKTKPPFINYLNEKKKTFAEAIQSGDLGLIKKYIDQNSDWLLLSIEGRKPLELAVETDNVEVLEYLLTEVAKKTGKTARSIINSDLDLLHWAVHNDCSNIAEYLIRRGADVNKVSSVQYKEGAHKFTPLHFVILNKNEALMNHLIEKGASLSKINGATLAPYEIIVVPDEQNILANKIKQYATAINEGDLETIKKFIKQNENWLWVPIREGTSPLAYAVQSDQVAIVSYFIDQIRRCTGDARSKIINSGFSEQPFSLLSHAIMHNRVNSAQFLIDQGADVNVSHETQLLDGRSKRYSPLHLALYCQHEALALLLINNGANLLGTNDVNERPDEVINRGVENYVNPMRATKAKFVHALIHDDIEFVQKLLNTNPEWLLLPLTETNKNAYEIAAWSNSTEVFKLLIKFTIDKKLDDNLSHITAKNPKNSLSPLQFFALYSNDHMFAFLGKLPKVRAKLPTTDFSAKGMQKEKKSCITEIASASNSIVWLTALMKRHPHSCSLLQEKSILKLIKNGQEAITILENNPETANVLLSNRRIVALIYKTVKQSPAALVALMQSLPISILAKHEATFTYLMAKPKFSIRDHLNSLISDETKVRMVNEFMEQVPKDNHLFLGHVYNRGLFNQEPQKKLAIHYYSKVTNDSPLDYLSAQYELMNAYISANNDCLLEYEELSELTKDHITPKVQARLENLLKKAEMQGGKSAESINNTLIAVDMLPPTSPFYKAAQEYKEAALSMQPYVVSKPESSIVSNRDQQLADKFPPPVAPLPAKPSLLLAAEQLLQLAAKLPLEFAAKLLSHLSRLYNPQRPPAPNKYSPLLLKFLREAPKDQMAAASEVKLGENLDPDEAPVPPSIQI